MLHLTVPLSTSYQDFVVVQHKSALRKCISAWFVPFLRCTTPLDMVRECCLPRGCCRQRALCVECHACQRIQQMGCLISKKSLDTCAWGVRSLRRCVATMDCWQPTAVKYASSATCSKNCCKSHCCINLTRKWAHSAGSEAAAPLAAPRPATVQQPTCDVVTCAAIHHRYAQLPSS